jgi:hypothetical protein
VSCFEAHFSCSKVKDNSTGSTQLCNKLIKITRLESSEFLGVRETDSNETALRIKFLSFVRECKRWSKVGDTLGWSGVVFAKWMPAEAFHLGEEKFDDFLAKLKHEHVSHGAVVSDILGMGVVNILRPSCGMNENLEGC